MIVGGACAAVGTFRVPFLGTPVVYHTITTPTGVRTVFRGVAVLDHTSPLLREHGVTTVDDDYFTARIYLIAVRAISNLDAWLC